MSNLESNAAAKAEHPRIVIKINTAATDDPCAVCGGYRWTAAPPCLDLFVEGADREVCMDCGERYAPELALAVNMAWNPLPEYAAARAYIRGDRIAEPIHNDIPL